MAKVDFTRRDFLKKTGKGALALAGGVTLEALVISCAHATFKEQAPVIYPPLKGKKIQSPINGCYVGFYEYKGFFRNDYFDPKGRLGKKPKIFVMNFPFGRSSISFPKWWPEKIYSEYRAIPYIHKTMYHSHRYGGF